MNVSTTQLYEENLKLKEELKQYQKDIQVFIPKEQFDAVLVKTNIELIQRVNRLIELLESKEDSITQIKL
jgi:hypothetical protein